MKTSRNIKLEKQRDNNIDSDYLPSRPGARLSHEEIIYEMITEIPQYFDCSEYIKDDSHILESKSRRYSTEINKKAKKCKSVSNKKKSVLNDEENIKSVETIMKANNTICSDEISKYEKFSDFDKALFKLDGNELLYSGIILITDFRVKFVFDNDNTYNIVKLSRDYFSIPIFNITKLEKSTENKDRSRDKYNLEIHSKDNRILKFIVLNANLKLYSNLYKFAFPHDDREFFFFSYKYCGDYKNYNNCETDGWKIYDLYKELNRQGVDYKNEKSRYRISKINKFFTFSYSYPKDMVVPRFFTDEDISECGNFRSNNRTPILSWQSIENKCCIWRSSQPKTGLTHQRSAADEKLLKMITDYADSLIIYDARPYINALANRLKGGGFEIVENYHKCEVKFCDIHNIHAARTSMQKKDNKKFFSELEKTGWFEFISQIIKSSIDISNSIKSGSSVLIHCADGWDRSSQISSLSQLIIDPYFRTIEGFIVLIEKDWLSFGHQFGYRSGNYSKVLSEEQRAPIFVQWLDCVHQILGQFPHAFEFNMDLLIFIANNYGSCQYGTFLFNNDKERDEFDAKNRTVSIWSDILKKSNFNNFINPYYLPNSIKQITPNFSFYKLRLWEEYFFQYYLNELEIKTCIDGEFTTFNSKYKMIQQLKTEDVNLINTQKETISYLNNIIKDLSLVVYSKNMIDSLNETSKKYIENLDLVQIIPKTNSNENDGVKKTEKMSYNFVEDYMTK